eukprot:m.50113 g.50113  ORF g.50113 m.50113 type:complete len:342 (-) comp13393_c0_seq1:19-1044(-)
MMACLTPSIWILMALLASTTTASQLDITSNTILSAASSDHDSLLPQQQLVRQRRDTTLPVNFVTEPDKPPISRQTSLIILSAVLLLVVIAIVVLACTCGFCDTKAQSNMVIPLTSLTSVEHDDDGPSLLGTKPRRASNQVDTLPVPLAGPVARPLLTANNNSAQLQLQPARSAWMASLDESLTEPPHPSTPFVARDLSIRLPARQHVQDMSEREQRQSSTPSTPRGTLDRDDPWAELQQSSFIVPVQRTTAVSSPRNRRGFEAEQARLHRDSHYGFDDEFDDQLQQALDPFESDVDDEEYNGELDDEQGTYLDIEQPDQPPPHFEEPYQDVSVLLNALSEA